MSILSREDVQWVEARVRSWSWSWSVSGWTLFAVAVWVCHVWQLEEFLHAALDSWKTKLVLKNMSVVQNPPRTNRIHRDLPCQKHTCLQSTSASWTLCKLTWGQSETRPALNTQEVSLCSLMRLQPICTHGKDLWWASIHMSARPLTSEIILQDYNPVWL